MRDGDGGVAERVVCIREERRSACRQYCCGRSPGRAFRNCLDIRSLERGAEPSGVHGVNPSVSPIRSLPTLTGWNPSTSFKGSSRLITLIGLICAAAGAAPESHPLQGLGSAGPPLVKGGVPRSWSSFYRNDTHFGASLDFSFNIDLGRGVIAHQNNGEARVPAGHPVDRLLNLFLNLFRYRRAVL